jgi:uncharacterized LabA/DUF88 family protein
MKCAVFIDGNNVFHSAKQLGVEVDYKKMLDMLVGEGRQLLRAFFYTGVDENEKKQHGFLLWMRRNGFRVVEKPLWTDNHGNRRAPLDVEIATDMMAFGDKVDTIVLVSGDEDFSYPLSILAQRGVRIEVYGFERTTSSKLMDCADKFFSLDALVGKFRKDGAFDEY